jgi:hypothetical protein
MIAGGFGLVGAGSLIQLQGAMLDRLWTFPSGQFEKSPWNSSFPHRRWRPALEQRTD